MDDACLSQRFEFAVASHFSAQLARSVTSSNGISDDQEVALFPTCDIYTKGAFLACWQELVTGSKVQ